MRPITTITAVAALLCALAGPVANAQNANSQGSVFEACAAQMKEEFGEAEFEFDKFRKAQGNKRFAFGRMKLTDGSSRSVRCQVERGRVRGIRFRTGNSAAGQEGGFWSMERPEGAEFVPPAAETENEAATTQPEQTQDTAATDPDAEGTSGTDAPVEDATNNAEVTDQAADQAADQTSAGDVTSTGDAADETTDGTPDEDAETSQDGEKLFRPVFRRVN